MIYILLSSSAIIMYYQVVSWVIIQGNEQKLLDEMARIEVPFR